jgi:hypothetical protein
MTMSATQPARVADGSLALIIVANPLEINHLRDVLKTANAWQTWFGGSRQTCPTVNG